MSLSYINVLSEDIDIAAIFHEACFDHLNCSIPKFGRRQQLLFQMESKAQEHERPFLSSVSKEKLETLMLNPIKAMFGHTLYIVLGEHAVTSGTIADKLSF